MNLFNAGIGVLLLAIFSALNADPSEKNLQKKLWNLEKSSGGRLGFYAQNLNNSKEFRYRSMERFPMGSTFKVVAVGAALKKAVTDPKYIKSKVFVSDADIQKGSYAPVTRRYKNKKMSIEQLCEAAITASDNTATNLIMGTLNGPDSITQFARSLGDTHFRLDRWEPELNTAIPDDPRDTSSPKSMTRTLTNLATGSVLGPKEKNLLIKWLKANKTGQNRIRAGIPPQWIAGDKTGTGSYGTTNDIGMLWLPDGTVIVLSIFFTQKTKGAPAADHIIASATKILVEALNEKS